MSSIAKPQGFSDQELQELLERIQGADSVELKLTVPDEDRRSTVVALGMDALDAYLRLRRISRNDSGALERCITRCG